MMPRTINEILLAGFLVIWILVGLVWLHQQTTWF
jgi:hypothetical protein